jgi:hypothetical protein
MIPTYAGKLNAFLQNYGNGYPGKYPLSGKIISGKTGVFEVKKRNLVLLKVR